MKTIATITNTALAGLAALALSACGPAPPQEPEPPSARFIKVSTAGAEWTLYNFDNDPKTFEVVVENVYGANKSLTVLYTGNHRKAALEFADETQIMGMTAQDRDRFNALGSTIVQYKEAADAAAYNEAKFRYEQTK